MNQISFRYYKNCLIVSLGVVGTLLGLMACSSSKEFSNEKVNFITTNSNSYTSSDNSPSVSSSNNLIPFDKTKVVMDVLAEANLKTTDIKDISEVMDYICQVSNNLKEKKMLTKYVTVMLNLLNNIDNIPQKQANDFINLTQIKYCKLG